MSEAGSAAGRVRLAALGRSRQPIGGTLMIWITTRDETTAAQHGSLTVVWPSTMGRECPAWRKDATMQPFRQAPRFGYCVPMFANPGAAFFRTPGLTTLNPVASVEAAVESERLGFDSVWAADHLMHGHDGGIMEGWTTLSVIAGKTSRVQLGTIHLAQPFRAPSLAAKMAATLDALSGGRLIFFYDCGWQEAEVRAYGLDWPSEDERIARMDDGLRLIGALWSSDEPVSFDGRYYRT